MLADAYVGFGQMQNGCLAMMVRHLFEGESGHMGFVLNQCGIPVNHRSNLMRSVARQLNKLQPVIHRIRFNTQREITDPRKPVELRSRAEQSTDL